MTEAFAIGAFFAGVRATAGFADTRVAAGRFATDFFATFFATAPTLFFGAFFAAFLASGRDAAVRVAADFVMAFVAAFVVVFFVALLAATLRDAAFFIALPLRIPRDGAAHALDAVP